MWTERRRRRRKDEFAAPLPAEPAFERPSDEAYARKKQVDLLGRSPTGAWADGRTPPPASPADDAPAFVDPGSFALANHAIPLMESKSLPVGAVGSASADLDAGPVSAGPSAPGPAPGGLAD
ncbi:MAG TPA: hypothetical protein VKE22_07355 [Haliangiales bacterium]|nr:hypothetical protein [Haliangiales bacterium]